MDRHGSPKTQNTRPWPEAQLNPPRGDARSRAAGGVGVDWINDLQRARISGPSLGVPVSAAWGERTTAVHAGSRPDPRTGALGTPIHQNTTFLLGAEQYQSIEEGYARDRFIYTRYGNPSQWAVQEKIAALEGAESALVFSSGMASIAAAVFSLVDGGGHIVASRELYGGTYALLDRELPPLGIEVSFVDPRDLSAVEAALRPETQVLFFEAVTNPLLNVTDIPGLARIAKTQGARLIIDGTFVSPLGAKALDLGANLVVHSASKYLAGHSDLIAGALAGSRKLVDLVWPRLQAFGGCLDPSACFLLERSLKTLPLRMRAHQKTALCMAQYLEKHPAVRWVLHPSLPSHPDHGLAQRILPRGIGMVSFELMGGDAAGLALLDALDLPRPATSLGGVESLISLPFNTSHAGYTARQRAGLGIRPGCVRLSVGIEDFADLKADFERALASLSPSS